MTTRNRAETKDQEVYRSLRKGILANTYRSGEPLREEELCEQMNVTRTPLRLALRRLEQEQLVTNEPFKGCRVREVLADELEPLFDLREVLEGLAARNVAAKNDPAGIDVLRDIAAGCDEAEQAQQWTAFFEQDKAFHRELIRQAGNDKLAEIMEIYDFQLRTFALHHRYLLEVIKQLAAKAPHLVRNHRDLVDALESGNGEVAEDRFRKHVRASKEIVTNACHQWQAAQARLTVTESGTAGAP